MNVLDLQRPQVTIFNGLLSPVVSLLTFGNYHEQRQEQVE
jgi:hypothetical protein